MAKLLKLRRGTTTQHGSFTGAEGEVTIDTTKDTAVVHDGSQAGGRPLAREDMSNVSSSSIVGQITASALAGTKVQPNFGTQDIETTGNIDLSDSTGSGNNRIKLGTGDDFQIYHSSTQNYLVSSNGNIELRHTVGGANEAMFKAMPNAQTELYYDGSRKLHTRADAVNIIGDIDMTDADNYKINIGAGSDLQIFHNGTNSFISNSTGNLQIDSDALVQVNATEFKIKNAADTETIARFIQDGACQLYHNNVLKLNTNSNGVRFVGMLAGIDNEKVALGTGNDLQIYHNGSNSFIQNSTGDLVVPTQELRVTNAVDNENLARFQQNGAAELYYDNSKKLETTSAGVTVTGNVVAGDVKIPDNGVIRIGGDASALGDLRIYHDGSNSYIKESGTGDLFIRNGNDDAIRCRTDGAVELYHDNNKKFETTSGGATITGNILPEANNTRNIGDGTTNFNSIWASNRFRGNDSVSLDLGNSIDLKIRHDGTDNLIEAPTGMDLKIMTGTGDNANETCATFENNGAVKLYYDNSHKVSTATSGLTVTNNNDLRIQGGLWTGEYSGGIKIQPDANNSYFQYQNTLYFRRGSDGSNRLNVDSTGNVTASGNVTAYSDARLKTNVNTINDALSIVGKLRGVSFDWKETGKPSIGVIAQEVEEVIPEVVLTNVDTDPATGKTTEVKSVDYGKIVGVLINAINELKAEVDELKGGK